MCMISGCLNVFIRLITLNGLIFENLMDTTRVVTMTNSLKLDRTFVQYVWNPSFDVGSTPPCYPDGTSGGGRRDGHDR
jgi:hypothetical protein